MARNAGYSSLQRHLDANHSYSTLSSSLLSQQATSLQSQLNSFSYNLSQFSSQHRTRILSSPSFRAHFSQLCAELGVDPLGGPSKGVWDRLGLGEWYYALGVQIVDVCLRARERGGGLVGLDEVLIGVRALRAGGANVDGIGNGIGIGKGKGKKVTEDISEQDVRKALDALDPLGCGYSLLTLPGSNKKVVRCYPGDLDTDSLRVVEVAAQTGKGFVGEQEMEKMMGWGWERADRAVEKALEEGLVWIDEQGESGEVRTWWVPALWEFGGTT